jgi:AcrR family transcriptional regulator
MVKQASFSASRQERKKEETRMKIVNAAMALFKQRGFAATSMEQIAQEADVARRTLYNHFPVKEAIIDEYIKRSFKENNTERILRLQKLPDTRARMIQVFLELIEGVQASKDFFEPYLVYRMQNMVSFEVDESEKSGFHLVAVELIRLGQKTGEIRNDLPPYVLEDMFEFVFVEIVKQFYLKLEEFNAREAIERCVDPFLNGVKSESK